MKTSLSTLCTFWLDKILWHHVTDMLMFDVENFNLKIMKFLILHINFTNNTQVTSFHFYQYSWGLPSFFYCQPILLNSFIRIKYGRNEWMKLVTCLNCMG